MNKYSSFKTKLLLVNGFILELHNGAFFEGVISSGFAFGLSDQSWPNHYQSMRFQGAQSPESESYVRVTLRPRTLIDKPLVSMQRLCS